jgi:hypothetical protein
MSRSHDGERCTHVRAPRGWPIQAMGCAIIEKADGPQIG